VRAKQSSTASQDYRGSEGFPSNVPIHAALACAPGSQSPRPGNRLFPATRVRALPAPVIADGEGLLHDARNLMGALGLYCDLLSLPGVLKPEHRHYAEEVRLLGERSAAMIQQLMEHTLQRQHEPAGSWLNGPASPGSLATSQWTATKPADCEPRGRAGITVGSLSLRSVVEHCSGLLGRVAGGWAIEIAYGPAAAVPVRAEEETVERILVNLVRNSAAALRSSAPASRLPEARCASNPTSLNTGTIAAAGSRAGERQTLCDLTSDRPINPIRIEVGLLVNRVGDPKPWPFRRVRLTVEDSGCGMSPEQLERLLADRRAPSRGSHGIGFRVVRELVAATDGDLRVMSSPGAGTRVQIEWPMAAEPVEAAKSWSEPGIGADRRLSC